MESIEKITKENIRDIKRKAKEKGSYVLLQNSTFGHVAELDLHSHPTIGTDEGLFSIVTSNSVNNREYILRKRIPTENSEWEQCYDSFDKLVFGQYHFKIGRIDYSSLTTQFSMVYGLFIPNKSLIPEALRISIKSAVDEIQPRYFTEENIDQMVNYAVEDLKTRAVINKNVEAGMEADILLF